MKKLPVIDLRELEELKKKNFKERLNFIKFYANKVKKESFKTGKRACSRD